MSEFLKLDNLMMGCSETGFEEETISFDLNASDEILSHPYCDLTLTPCHTLE